MKPTGLSFTSTFFLSLSFAALSAANLAGAHAKLNNMPFANASVELLLASLGLRYGMKLSTLTRQMLNGMTDTLGATRPPLPPAVA